MKVAIIGSRREKIIQGALLIAQNRNSEAEEAKLQKPSSSGTRTRRQKALKRRERFPCWGRNARRRSPRER